MTTTNFKDHFDKAADDVLASSVFRFRPDSLITEKELLYHEIYFPTISELNDPLDTLVRLPVRKGELHVHKFFIRRAIQAAFPWSSDIKQTLESFKNELSQTLSQRDHELSECYRDLGVSRLRNLYEKHGLPDSSFERLAAALQKVAENFYPHEMATCSFSHTWHNPMLWSLYADSHRGFCLCFVPSDGKLRLRKHFSEEWNEFELNDVTYSNQVDVPPSLMFHAEDGRFDAELMSTQFFPLLRGKTLLTKHVTFREEEETRLVSSVRVTYGATLDRDDSSNEEEMDAPVNRLYHFDPQQLRGVIFGFAMDGRRKRQITEILSNNNSTLFFFDCSPAGNTLQTRCDKAQFGTGKTT